MFGKVHSEEEIFEEDVKTIFSSVSTPIKELNIKDITNLVKERCIENGVQTIDKIYGFENGCPICLNDYTKETWVVLHPCGHLLCYTCLSKINNYAKSHKIARICPICRDFAKWIGPTDHNLNKQTIQIGSSQLFTFGGVNYNNNYEQATVLIPSIPPIKILDMGHIFEPKIECQVSRQTFEIEGVNKTVGNISIVADELISDTNGIDLLIVFDVSGSMSRVANEGITILKYVVDCLDSKDRLSIITFDSKSKQLFALQPMTSSIKPNCKEIIDKCFTGGSTNMKSAVDLMVKVKQDGMINSRPFKIIILSDGNPDIGKEGYELIPKLYEGEIKPEIYSCTFGDNVKADVMKHFLTEENMLNYNHIENMNQFKSLTSEIGLDKNIVIGTNIVVKLENVQVTSKLANSNNSEIKFEQIKTSDVFTIPFIINTDSEPNIMVTYTTNSNQEVIMENKYIDELDNFVKNNFWFKRIGEQIRDVMLIDNKNTKLEILNKIISNVTIENLGDFFQEINDLITQTRLTIQNEHNNTYYNTCTSTVQKTYSHASKTSNMIYKTKIQNN